MLGDLERALVDDLEVADLLDRVAPELQADRVLLGRREHVEDPAAHRELTALVDEVGARVGSAGQTSYEVVHRDVVALVHLHRLEVAETCHERLEHGSHRRDEDAYGAVVGVVGVREAAQHAEAPTHGVARGAQPLVRERLPGRELRHGVRRQQALERRGEVLGLTRGRRNGEHWAAAALVGSDRRHDQRVEGRRRRQVERLGGVHRAGQARPTHGLGDGRLRDDGIEESVQRGRHASAFPVGRACLRRWCVGRRTGAAARREPRTS